MNRTATIILAWFGLAILSGVVALQIYGFIISVGWAMTQNEAFHRFGWNSYTIGLISRFGALIAGIFWIFYISFIENLIQRWDRNKQLKDKFLRTAGYLVMSAVILFGLGYLANLGQ